MDKDSIAAEYALGGLSNNLFVSRYISYIPNKGQLIAQIEAVLNEWNKVEKEQCIFRKNRALAPHERSAVPLGTDHCPVG